MNPTPPLSGQTLDIRCTLRAGRVAEVAVTPRRAPPVEKLVVGKPPEAVPGLFGHLYALCRHAQAQAAAVAIERALGIAVSPEWTRRREAARILEIIREHGLNLLLRQPEDSADPALARDLIAACRSWHQALGGDRLWERPAGRDDRPADPDEFTDHRDRLDEVLRRLLGGFLRMADPALDEVAIWAETADSPAARRVCGALAPGWAEFGACASAPLPELEEAELEAVLGGPEAAAFVRLPDWRGLPRETGSFARQSRTPLLAEAVRRYGNGLLGRVLARLVEIRELYARLRSEPVSGHGRNAATVGSGVGLVQVEASRGRLIHRVEIRGGRVADYRIVAPTEWNFHPQGLIPEALAGLPVADPAGFEARLAAWLHAVDPCVDFRVAVLQA
jgi:hypothetical protein